MVTRSAAGKTPRPAAKAAKTVKAAKPTPKPAPKVAAPKPLPKPAAAPAEMPKAAKLKLVRDSFTMPQADFALIGVLKERALGFKRPTKKSELLRAGLQVLAGLNDTALRAALNALPPLKPGRPKKGD